MDLKDIIQKIEAYLNETLREDISLYLIEEIMHPRYPKIIITLDKESGISIGECTEVHKNIIDRFRDENILERCSLEVSSVGLTRTLKYSWEIDKNISRFVRVNMRKAIDDKYAIEGYIDKKEGDMVFIRDKEDNIYQINYEDIKKIQLSLEGKVKK